MDDIQAPHPATVSEGTSPAGAVRARWAWTAPEVWTPRMLTALEAGVRGGRWYTLMDKVSALPPLRAAFCTGEGESWRGRRRPCDGRDV
jgi:hypothetical protein